MGHDLELVRRENVEGIVMMAPGSYSDNLISHDKCNEAGESLLAAIEAAGGMTDELDRQAAVFIEKARNTVKRMNERRSPVTKLFDDVRKAFTALENGIDPLKQDTVAYRLQQLRNRFAAMKRAEAEERRRRELERRQDEELRRRLREDISDDLKRQFIAHLDAAYNRLKAVDDGLTLENYDVSLDILCQFPVELEDAFLDGLHTCIRIPAGVGGDEFREAEAEVKEGLCDQFRKQYSFDVQDTRDYILDRLPSRRKELERIAAAGVEEAERMREELEARRVKEAVAEEDERSRKEAEERRRRELERRQAETVGLFAQQAAVQQYQPKVKVSKKIELLNAEGVMPVLSMWWSREGSRLSVEELTRMFKKQLTFCEKLANKEDVFIEDESVCYVDDVKAK